MPVLHLFNAENTVSPPLLIDELYASPQRANVKKSTLKYVKDKGPVL